MNAKLLRTQQAVLAVKQVSFT